jgi:cytochrome c oxidase assembly protein subunit 11
MPARIENKQIEHRQVDNKKIIGKLTMLVIIMFGFGFALVPLYDVFCDLTGLNGKTADEKVAFNEPPLIDKGRLVSVQFISNTNDGMPWEFKPMTKEVKVHPGESNIIEYIVRNTTNQTIIGQAVPSVAPGLAAAYFHKTECFCFTEQKLEPGEERLMPVTFIVDSALPKKFNELTLSYTFFIKESSEETVKNPLAMQHNQEN